MASLLHTRSVNKASVVLTKYPDSLALAGKIYQIDLVMMEKKLTILKSNSSRIKKKRNIMIGTA